MYHFVKDWIISNIVPILLKLPIQVLNRGELSRLNQRAIQKRLNNHPRHLHFEVYDHVLSMQSVLTYPRECVTRLSGTIVRSLRAIYVGGTSQCTIPILEGVDWLEASLAILDLLPLVRLVLMERKVLLHRYSFIV